MFRITLCWMAAVALIVPAVVADGYDQRPIETPGISPRAAGAGRKAGPSKVRNRAGMEFVLIPAGKFRMGSASDEAGDQEKPVTEVTIGQAFYMGKHEVTQKQWEKLMGNRPSDFKRCNDCPVEHISWNDAQAFVRALNDMEDSKRYRLPTEAEWEYAARGGTAGDRYGANLDAIAWYDKNCDERPHPVGKKKPNGFGLYDMLGNVYEWVQDWKGTYPGGEVTDPRGPARGKFRMMRGGSWENGAQSCRATHRLDASPGFRIHVLGLRVLMEAR